MSSSVRLPSSVKVYYLDTCVWSPLAESEVARDGFVSYFQSSDRVLALSYFDLFELSRPPRTLPGRDFLFLQLRHQAYVPYLNNQVIESELKSFPKIWKMRWLPLSLLADEENPSVLQTLADNPHFIKSRDEHYQFGLDHFMNLEQFKENYLPLYGDECTVDDASPFAWGDGMDYLGRHFPHFLGSHLRFIRKRNFDGLNSLLSLRIRSLFVFFKYYLHGQSPEESDFMDFAHVSYAPYCNVFVTERNVCNVLNHIKSSGLMLSNTEVFHVSDFLAKMSKVSASV